MSKIVGIDLGTTNSVIAVLEGGEPTVITTAEGSRLTPSIVAFTKTGERLVGQTAKRQATINPENTIFSVKRFIGRHFDEPETTEDRSRLPYPIEKGRRTMYVSACPSRTRPTRRRRSRLWSWPR